MRYKHRHTARLPGYNYTQSGAYFVTICTHGRECIFDDARLMRLVELQWRSIGRYCPGVAVDEFVVMPNHVHGIVWINRRDPVGVQHTASSDDPSGMNLHHASNLTFEPACAAPLHTVRAGSLAAIVRAFKSSSTKRVNELRRTPGFRVWQRSYWDRIVRNEAELNRVRQYIRDNPLKWEDDPNHPRNRKAAI